MSTARDQRLVRWLRLTEEDRAIWARVLARGVKELRCNRAGPWLEARYRWLDAASDADARDADLMRLVASTPGVKSAWSGALGKFGTAIAVRGDLLPRFL